jgi:hypothetical protein
MDENEGMRDLKPASAAEVEESLSFALRFAGKRRVHDADERMSRITAERLVEHLQRSGFVVLKRASAAIPSSSQHPHPHKP